MIFDIHSFTIFTTLSFKVSGDCLEIGGFGVGVRVGRVTCDDRATPRANFHDFVINFT